ncbi:gamma-glutamyltransferase [Thiohalobacter thiocyanaticus]|uniref:Glutathione hydrolase proenzyme n=1 Tax=Thiohalobacter thiocyanaticus TaxID=585455 RepID=A0A1Z4VVC1_9GAMM|nr:gamma-glutamyltransferase [Thiohalobacter thiocyanaticus]BAZ95405.1 gamma-glutamyltransferase [Thiohalobacter thiocyanaticus]
MFQRLRYCLSLLQSLPVLALSLLVVGVPVQVASAAERPGATAIASAHPHATAAGFEILAAGGNAFDAAVAVSAALAVVEPYGSGIGGGGFWLLHVATENRDVMIDGRERAPLAAHRDMYLDDAGNLIPGASMNGPLAAGIPGEPAALVHLAEQYGRLPLARSLAPAIRLARAGFEVEAHYRRMAAFRRDVLRESADAARIFLREGEVPAEGVVIRQPELADTLQALAGQGRDGFYAGKVADRLVTGVRAAGGIWTQRDLDEYEVIEREPVRGEYHGMRITSAAPPSSGGIALVTMLNILEGYGLQDLCEVERTHLIVEAMRRAYRDRAVYLGDTDYVEVPVAMLTSPHYAAGLRNGIRRDQATPSASLPGPEAFGGGNHTTHFSILDREGNRVAATLSINYPFGAGFVVPGTGVLLNDEMDDFSAKPGVPNAYGLVGTEANAIAPGKRMLSSMSPTFVETDDRVAILGTPGGSRIITMVLHGILGFAADKPVQDWVSEPRFHHQYLPDVIQFEPEAFGAEMQQQLKAMGHELKPLDSSYGNMQAIQWNRATGEVRAASDPRGIGEALIEHVGRVSP